MSILTKQQVEMSSKIYKNLNRLVKIDTELEISESDDSGSES